MNKKVANHLAFTGEISLNGDILKVGGIKEKIIGAYNHGITDIFIPALNELDLEEVPDIIREKMNIVLVKNYQEIFDRLFL